MKTYRGYVINMWFFHHRAHRLRHILLAELKESMFIPDSFKVELRPAQMLLQNSKLRA